MEPQKDITQKDENKTGHNMSQHLPADSSPVDYPEKAGKLSGGNRGSVLSKTEKLVTATYMVTSLIPKEESLRTKVRDKNLDLLSHVHSYSGHSQGKEFVFYGRAASLVDEIISLLGIASSVGLVSAMNFSILRSEYSNLKHLLKPYTALPVFTEGTVSLDESFFVPDGLPAGLSEASEETYGVHGMSDKGQGVIKDRVGSMSFMEDINSELTPHRTGGSVKKSLSGNGNKSQRRESIIRVLKKKKDITIKDLSVSMSNCSEKTIQRELLAMVADGVLKKEGEKRWSRYSLVQ